MEDIDRRPSRHNESLDEKDTQFAFGAAVGGGVLGTLGVTAAMLALFVAWPHLGRDNMWVTVTVGLLQASGILMLVGMCAGAIAVFAPGLPRRLGLLVVCLCAIGWMSIYLYSSWPTSNTLIGAAETGDWQVVRVVLALGIDPDARADPNRWDARYGYDESEGRSALDIALEHDHVAVVRELQAAGMKVPAGYKRPTSNSDSSQPETLEGETESPESVMDENESAGLIELP